MSGFCFLIRHFHRPSVYQPNQKSCQQQTRARRAPIDRCVHSTNLIQIGTATLTNPHTGRGADIVSNMGYHSEPQRAAPPHEITEERSQQQPGHKSEKLHVYGAEYDCRNPYCHMRIDWSGRHQPLQRATEKQFFGKSGKHTHYKYRKHKTAHRCTRHEHTHHISRRLLAATHPCLQGTH